MARSQDFQPVISGSERSTLAFYEENATSYAFQTAQADLTQLYSRFLSLVPPGGRILDLGCGGGRDLRVFKSLGFDCLGVDPSAHLAQIAAEYSACEVIVARAQDLDYVGEFDGVWACASLLHLSPSELPAAIAHVRKALRLDGVFFLSMQEGIGNSVAPDGRFYARYSSFELRSMLLETGLDVIDGWTTLDTLPGREPMHWLNLLARKLTI